MTMFTRPRVSPTDYHESTDWLRPSFGGYLSTVAQDAIHDFPTVAVADLNQLYGVSAQSAGISMDYDETGFPVVSYSKQTPDIMDTAAQAQRIKEAGLEKELKPEAGYSGPMLDVIIERKRAELERKTTRAAAPDSWAPAGLAVGLGTSMLDPINIASAFLPIVPEARAMSLLDKAGTGLRRAAVRGGIGAVEGAGGAAVLEPLTAMTRNQEQADYGLADSLSNVAFGAVFGAALHPAAGAVGDWLRAKAGMRQNWEFVPSTPDTMGLKDAHAKDIFAAREAATPDADKVRLGQESQAAAALFDARARAWAYDMQRPVSEYYEGYKPTYQVGEHGKGDNLFQPSMETVKSADHALREDADAWADTLQAFIAQNLSPRKSVPMLRQTPLVLQMLGAENLPVETTYNVLKKVLVEKHKLPVETIQQVPAAMADPVMVFRSATQGGDLVMMLDVKDRNGSTIVVPIALKQDSPAGYSINLAPSVYAKNSADSGKPNNRWFINQVQSGNLLYRNQKKSRAWEAMVGLQLPPTHFTNTGKQRLFTDNDLVKLREANPSLYQEDIGAALQQSTSEPQASTSPDMANNSSRAAVSFDADGKSVVQFFGSSDFSSAPHELYHVFRREMEQTAAHPDAPARVRESWDKMQEFVGAEPGMAWTREMEEKFAKAGERFLLEGKAPSPALQDVFERLRQWFLELYASADASGLDISDDMRGVFGNMLSTPMKDGDAAFRYALGSLMARSFAEDAETRLPKQPELDGKPLEVVQSLGDEAVKDLDAQWRQTQEAHPELKDTVGEAYRKDVSVAEAEAVDAARRKEILDEIALCETRH